MALQNDLFLRAAAGQITAEVPVWLMRQAGRYLKEYNQVRSRAGSFMDLCFNPELLTEVTLQPIKRFSLDAAIIFSDILLVPYAMNMGLDFVDHIGPVFNKPITSEKDIDDLSITSVLELLHPVYEGIKCCKKELGNSIPLIGFVGSPFTLSCYMLEGKSSSDFMHIKKFRYGSPRGLLHLLDIISKAVEIHLLAQIESGVDAVMIFDSYAGILSPHDYLTFSLPFIQRLIKSVKTHSPDVPVIVFAKGGGGSLKSIALSGCDVVGLDWTVDLASACEIMRDFSCAIQGNLDPLSLLGSPDEIASELIRIVKAVKDKVPYIFNLGHGVHRLTPVENVDFLIRKVRELFFVYD
ncbi:MULTISPECIES: uroporphyrinogen decarboxylase [Candidatus Ichthyocystis]|uniref:Uroporphyrinogen decarboxylase n=1 Tax=Candidatus Ichthyocystis hellenicum TaxID=1561003 RepID=A0A0S4M2N7_9BURK|nr:MULTISPECIES: uroporphyrinogen decarboxylase [Ichthyocystis]CUT17279.1 Uroporphyrinogen decarboxylase [Candidatus Ichthyocystis hellenicum]